MRIFLLSCLLIIGISCQRQQSCDYSYLESKFNLHLNNLERNYRKDLVLSTDLLKSIYFLSSVSNIESNVIYGDVTVYRKNSDFRKDLSNWKKWFHDNKCSVSKEKIITIENKVEEDYKWNKEDSESL